MHENDHVAHGEMKLLTDEERQVATRRMALDARQADLDTPGASSQLRGLKAAFTDPKTYILALAYHGITGAAGFHNFYPSLTATLGYSRIVSLLLVAPPYTFTTFYSLAHGLASDRRGDRFWFYLYPVPLVVAGALIFMFTDSFAPRYVSLFLLNMIFVMNGTIYAWVANAIPRPPAKRAAALAFMNAVGNMASIWTPFTYRDTDRPQYRDAMGINIGLVGLAAIWAITMRFYLRHQNRRRDRMESDAAVLTARDQKILAQTAEREGIDIATARTVQQGYRYMI